MLSKNSQRLVQKVRNGPDARRKLGKRGIAYDPNELTLVVSAQSDTGKVVWRDAGY